jgi:dihydrofolate reductase
MRSSTISSGRSAPTLYGRRMYEAMVFWETASTEADEPACSGTMPGSGGQLRRSCIPGRFRRYPARGHRSSASSIETPSAAQAVLGADIAIGGAELAGHAIGAGLVDECHLFLCPIVVGGGKRALPDTSARNSNFSMNAGSETASFTSTTA